VEGVSFLLLLGVAMPLKYFADLPVAVKAVGWIHGLLFVLYVIAIAEVSIKRHWSFALIFAALAAAFIPFGTFVLDTRLRREEQAARSPAALGWK
ncbi:MAG: DUF3817 domain-containing protein, partial [Pyrinomonadaceae bacterium]